MWHQFIDGDRRRTFPVINSLTVTDCRHFSVINRLMATDCGHFSVINQLMAGKRMQTLTEWPLMAENDFKTYPVRANVYFVRERVSPARLKKRVSLSALFIVIEKFFVYFVPQK
jgi:hypothetical protein